MCKIVFRDTLQQHYTEYIKIKQLTLFYPQKLFSCGFTDITFLFSSRSPLGIGNDRIMLDVLCHKGQISQYPRKLQDTCKLQNEGMQKEIKIELHR